MLVEDDSFLWRYVYYFAGFPDMNSRYMPEKVKSFDKKNFVAVKGGQHHTVALDQDGRF